MVSSAFSEISHRALVRRPEEKLEVAALAAAGEAGELEVEGLGHGFSRAIVSGIARIAAATDFAARTTSTRQAQRAQEGG